MPDRLLETVLTGMYPEIQLARLGRRKMNDRPDKNTACNLNANILTITK